MDNRFIVDYDRHLFRKSSVILIRVLCLDKIVIMYLGKRIIHLGKIYLKSKQQTKMMIILNQLCKVDLISKYIYQVWHTVVLKNVFGNLLSKDQYWFHVERQR